jgi:prolyl-tRNA synthetase
MGCYGLGISRLVGALAEQRRDERGLIWPESVAPADVHIVIAGNQHAETAERIVANLDVDVVLDDRSVSAGVKFADAELLGIPTIVVFGRGLARGVVEVRDRASGDVTEVPVDRLADRLRTARPCG